ncbi:MAG: endonuclease/exonuclease/phosphatase family protein, partial [Nitrospirales bacterium]
GRCRMPSFPKPKFDGAYSVPKEIKALQTYRDTKEGRQIPAKAANRLLLATWNIANLGLQERRSQDHQLLAEIISWFDIVALQEVHDNLQGLLGIKEHLPASWRALFTDRAGNQERMAYLYDANKIAVQEKIGEVAIPVAEQKHIKLKGIPRKFQGFDRNPYLAAFQAADFRFLLVNVHLFFGKTNNKADLERRSLEAYAASRWADLRRKDKHAFVKDIIVLGDFNIPKVQPGDPIYDALRARGLRLPDHSTRIGSNLHGDKHYDQIMFFPGQTQQDFTGKVGVFDFDGAVFSDLWNNPDRTEAQFRSYLRYYLSDHRPLWVEFQI